MPTRNSVKIYVENGIYHIYNRGVEKRKIFIDDHDYSVFLKFLKEALSPVPPRQTSLTTFTLQGQTFKGLPKLPKNFSGQLNLFAYCLMPNHFHLLIKQTTANTVHHFMQSLITRYSLYFNKKYKRIGSLFQGRYKGTLALDDDYLLHLSRYIHRNPKDVTDNLKTYYSSYGEYLGLRNTAWVNTSYILDYFKPGTLPGLKHINSYEDFVENYTEENTQLLDTFSYDDPS
jgi:putative transposase